MTTRQVAQSLDSAHRRYTWRMKKTAQKTKSDSKKRDRTTEPAISRVLDDGTLIELIRTKENTAFAVWRNGDWEKVSTVDVDGIALRPYSAENNIIKHKVVLLPSEPEEYGSDADLINEIEGYIHRYVDLALESLHLASRYVLLTWLYDRFNELPYLRLRGDYGSGKTRFLLIVGSICYKPTFANGASTVSPLFHLLDAFAGTLILDEADFRISDEKADIVKILNAGNVRGMPVLRTMINKHKEFDPRAFFVFGPKIIATRGHYDDPALESRCITEETANSTLRPDIPINLPKVYEEEAQSLRNNLLLYRFKTFHDTHINPSFVNPTVDNRINQIFVPLMSITKDKTVCAELAKRQEDGQSRLTEERNQSAEAHVLQIIRDAPTNNPLRLKDIRDTFIKRHAEDYAARITSRFIGTIIRTKLHIQTKKSHGIYAIPISEQPKLRGLFARYGIGEDGNHGIGDDVRAVPVSNRELGDNQEAPTAF